jgi:hypothetical protein
VTVWSVSRPACSSAAAGQGRFDGCGGRQKHDATHGPAAAAAGAAAAKGVGDSAAQGWDSRWAASCVGRSALTAAAPMGIASSQEEAND